MFERYTEKARRVIFFARYEASAFGSPEINTEHLLLGLIRDENRIKKWLPRADADVIRKRIESSVVPHQPIATNVDLPLSQTSKRVLNHAKDEADRLNSKHIGTEHLLLGLILEKRSVAGKLLREVGGDLKKLRKKFEGEIEPAQEGTSTSWELARRLRSALAETVQIHGLAWNTDDINAALRRCRTHNWHWHKARWTPRDVVIETKTGRFSFDLSLA
jgi:ATP-dependent Clp protease ATP-binding subunit ClpC